MSCTDLEQIDQIRLLIADTAEPSLLTDVQLSSLLGLYPGSVKRAAARALRTIAANEVLVSKKITTQDLSTDGPAVAAELRAQADQLEAEAAADEAAHASYASYIPPGGGATRIEGEEYRVASAW